MKALSKMTNTGVSPIPGVTKAEFLDLARNFRATAGSNLTASEAVEASYAWDHFKRRFNMPHRKVPAMSLLLAAHCGFLRLPGSTSPTEASPKALEACEAVLAYLAHEAGPHIRLPASVMDLLVDAVSEANSDRESEVN